MAEDPKPNSAAEAPASTGDSRDRPTSYWEYVRVEELLDLQRGLARDEKELANDEVLFIVIHQIDELWFKLLLRELETTRDLFAQRYVPDTAMASVVRSLQRMADILRHAANHFSLMESMTTRDYMSFRDKLYPASGFQSAQLREIEILMGLEVDERIALGHEQYLDALKHADGTPSRAYERVRSRLEDVPSLNQAVLDWLYRTPIDGSMPADDGDAEVVDSFVERYLAAQRGEQRALSERAIRFALTEEDRERLRARYERETEGAASHLRALDVEDPEARRRAQRTRAAILFIESYREHPLLSWPRAVVDALVAFEQAFIVFRQRHARMVERVIGNRTGTGGSAGVAYLDQTALRYRVFKELWATRTLLIRKEALPEIEHPESYGFVFEGRGPRDEPEG